MFLYGFYIMFNFHQDFSLSFSFSNSEIYGETCSTGDICIGTYQMCLSDTCICQIGYSYDKNTQTCVERKFIATYCYLSCYISADCIFKRLIRNKILILAHK